MSFDTRDIRPSMDVYIHGNLYLGTVIKVIPGSGGRVGGEQAETQAGEQVAAPAQQWSVMDGETLGPRPTQTIGNKGPSKQSAPAGFAVERDDATLIARGSIQFGKWWGLFGSRTVSIEDVQTVSIERVVLSRRQDEIKR